MEKKAGKTQQAVAEKKAVAKKTGVLSAIAKTAVAAVATAQTQAETQHKRERGTIQKVRLSEIFFPTSNIARETERGTSDFGFLRLLFGVISFGLLSDGVEPFVVCPLPANNKEKPFIPTAETWDNGKGKVKVARKDLESFCAEFGKAKKKYLAIDGFHRFKAYCLATVSKQGLVNLDPEITVEIVKESGLRVASQANNRLGIVQTTLAEKLASAWDLIPFGEIALYTAQDGNPPVCENKAESSGLYAFGLVCRVAGLTLEQAVAKCRETDSQQPDQHFRNLLNKELRLKELGTKLAKRLLDTDAQEIALNVLNSSRKETVAGNAVAGAKLELPALATFASSTLAGKILKALHDKNGKVLLECLNKVATMESNLQPVPVPVLTNKGKRVSAK